MEKAETVKALTADAWYLNFKNDKNIVKDYFDRLLSCVSEEKKERIKPVASVRKDAPTKGFS